MPGVPEARQDARLRRYPLRRLRLPVGAGQLSLVVPDERDWMREGAWAPSVVRGKEPPYWVRIWPAALAAARAVARLGDLGGVRVLDLGCGLGVPGVQASSTGAVVTFADLEADALAFAAWNARSQPGCADGPETVQLDWSRQVVPGTFDLLVLSDVSYRGLHHRPLRAHLDATLAAGGVALHADPHRDAASDFLAGLEPNYSQVSWSRSAELQERRADVRLTLLARDEAALSHWSGRFGAASVPDRR